MSVIIIILLGSKCIKHESRARDLVRAPMSYKIIQKHDRKNDMKIIIVGAGKAGIRLARTLTEEGHDITILDNNANKLSAACSDNDVLGIIGNGMSYSSLSIAGLSDADLLIAVTGSDEYNLLCCLFGKKAGHCSTIARIRNPLYLNETQFIKEQIGLSMVVNPEFAAAREISRLLRFPSAVEVNSFAKGRLDMITFKIPPTSLLNGRDLIYVRTKLMSEVLFCNVERGGKYYIPSGNFELHSGDKATVIIRPKDAQKFFKRVNIDTHSVKDAMIVGGGTMGFYLARQLLDNKIAVKIIERDELRCEDLAERLPDALIIHGNASDKNLLLEEGLTNTDAFVALTGLDEENAILSLYAKEVSDAKVVTKVNRVIFNDLIERLNLDSIIYPQNITTEHIMQYVRAKQNAMGNNVETLYNLVDDKIEALEFKIGSDSPMIGVTIKQLNLKENLIICGIKRGKRVIMPNGDEKIKEGDHVVVVTSQKKLTDFNDIFK